MLRSSSSARLDFDWHQLRQLAYGDTAFELELMAIFLEDTEDSLNQLEQAIAHQSIQAIADLAHALRGSSANVGASTLTQTAGQLERLVQSSPSADSFADLFAEASGLLAQMRHHCQSLQAHFQPLR